MALLRRFMDTASVCLEFPLARQELQGHAEHREDDGADAILARSHPLLPGPSTDPLDVLH